MELGFDLNEQIDRLGKISRTIRLGVVSLLLIGVGVAYWHFIYQEKVVRVVALEASNQELQRKLSNIRAVVANLPAFEEELKSLEVQLKQALRQLPDDEKFDDLLSEITTAGKKEGVRIKSIEPEPEIPHDFYAEVPFLISLDGSYHDIARFFERVGNFERIVNLGEFELDLEKESREITNLRMHGTATTFRFLKTDGEV
jgi:type IV pilus assembly protein PilO